MGVVIQMSLIEGKYMAPQPPPTSANLGAMLSSIGHSGNLTEGSGDGGGSSGGGARMGHILEIGLNPDFIAALESAFQGGFLQIFLSLFGLRGLEAASPFSFIFNFQSVGLASLGKCSPPALLPTMSLGGLSKGGGPGH
jgi:hypothetical protein